jgi:hypothetical protein
MCTDRPNEAFCLERARSQERRDREEQQETRVVTSAEICKAISFHFPHHYGGAMATRQKLTEPALAELIDRGNASLRVPRHRIKQEDLSNAYHDFARVLRALSLQSPAAQPKEFARIYQKLMSTSLRLSHMLTLSPEERMNYIREADRYGKLALENALKSQHSGRVAQMLFYLACVGAREVCLTSELDDSADAGISKRGEAMKAISSALAELRSVEGLDTVVYEAMAREYTHSLTDGAWTSI